MNIIRLNIVLLSNNVQAFEMFANEVLIMNISDHNNNSSNINVNYDVITSKHHSIIDAISITAE